MEDISWRLDTFENWIEAILLRDNYGAAKLSPQQDVKLYYDYVEIIRTLKLSLGSEWGGLIWHEGHPCQGASHSTKAGLGWSSFEYRIL